jgi:4-amino-4-deoxy-L-arabinose transferase-like glycosyltransferase
MNVTPSFDAPVASSTEAHAAATDHGLVLAMGKPRADDTRLPPPWLSWIESHPATVILGLIALVLLPFIGKPFHIDDPMYLWVARQIVERPLDFYGFDVFWTGSVAPMWYLNQNPPLTSYFIALVKTLFGETEIALHGAFLVPAALALAGTWRCARLYTRWPALATVVTGVTPVFALSGTTIMADMLMLGFWVWAFALWETGLRQRNWGWLVAAAAFAGLGILTKYPAINVIPLLCLAGIVRRMPARYFLPLLIPMAMLVAYEVWTRNLYGVGLFSQAMGYARGFAERQHRLPLQTACTAICFTGGCVAPVAMFLPWLAGRRLVMIGLMIWVAVFAAILWVGSPRLPRETVAGLAWHTPPLFAAQVALWSVVGAGVAWLVTAAVRRHRDGPSAVLAAWVLGVIMFAGLVNWSVNGRTLLPLAPPIGILVARSLDSLSLRRSFTALQLTPAMLLVAVAVAIALNAADHSLATASRRAAEGAAALARMDRARWWFQGHWGFQHYCQENGGRPFLGERTPARRGDIVVTPIYFSSNAVELGEPFVKTIGGFREALWGPLTVVHPLTGAAYYSDVFGPLPFAIGRTPDDRYVIQVVAGSASRSMP